MLLVLGLATWLFAWASTANAYTLAELIDDQSSFSSLNETVVFSDFELISTSLDESILEEYEVVPGRFGFWIYSIDSQAADPSEIAFSYQAEAVPGLLINGMGLSMTRLGSDPLNATAEMWVEDITVSMLAELDVSIQNGGNCGSACNRRYDADWAFFAGTQALQISEFIESGFPPVDWKTSHKFFVEPVPEPSTALLIGLGIAGFAFRRRRQLH